MKVQLIVVQGKPEGKVIPLTGPSFKIGRGENCHLRPNSELVSREHAELIVSDTTVMVRDLGSRNGTLVNNKPLSGPYVAKNGDLIQVGPLTFAVSIVGAAVPAAKATPGKGASLDDVSTDEIDSWLVGEKDKPAPDSSTELYKGDTMTFQAYKKPPSSVKIPTQPEPPTQVAAAPVAAAPAPEPPPAPAPAPPPAPVAVAPVPPPPEPELEIPIAIEPEPVPVAAVAPAPPPPAPAPPPRAPEPEFTPRPAPVHVEIEDNGEPLLTEEELFGSGANAKGNDDDRENDGDDEEADGEEEFVDENNPFYVAKKPGGPAAPAPASSKDTSEAANDILRRLMDRRRASRG